MGNTPAKSQNPPSPTRESEEANKENPSHGYLSLLCCFPQKYSHPQKYSVL